MTITLPELPFPKEALEPFISSKTLEFHHGKHHKAYVDNGNKLIEGTPFAGATLKTIITETGGDSTKTGIFNNCAQVWNHSFYWKCIKPGGGGEPAGKAGELIKSSYGGYAKFVEEFKNAAVTQFGSGWVWLVLKNGKAEILKTANADTPVAHGMETILTVDVWEHAYYLDYQNRRPDYVQTFLDKLINWDFVNSLL